jgi:hypothetical protein
MGTPRLFIASLVALVAGCAGSGRVDVADPGDLRDHEVCATAYADCGIVCVKTGFGKCLHDPCATLPGGVCPPPEAQGCTLPQGVWKSTPPDAWPIDGLTIGELTYSSEALHALLGASSDAGNAGQILYRQYVAAALNVAVGSVSSAVDEAASEALAWFDANLGGDGLPGSVSTHAELGQAALELASVLAAFNEGEIGPGSCLDD